MRAGHEMYIAKTNRASGAQRDLTQRERDTLLAFTRLGNQERHPTVAQLADAAGVSIATIRDRVENLIRLGALHSEGYGSTRVVTITAAGLQALEAA